MTLYEITEEVKKALDALEVNEDGEFIGLEELEAVQQEFDSKAEQIACYIKGLEAEADAVKAEADKQAKRAKALANKADNIRSWVATNMLALDMKEIKTARAKLSFRKSESVTIIDLEAVPCEYKHDVIETKADKTLIKKAIKAGADISGAVLEEKMNLQIS